MKYPNFYMQVSPIKLHDPLSQFLGAIEEGEVEITYLDCVKLAGHSCPTVAGAYLMAKEGLKQLFQDTLPIRGTVKVSLHDTKTQGVTGVIGNVIAYIVGANDESGFKGINGNFSRNNLLSFDVDMSGEVTLTRLDTQAEVTLSYDPSCVPPDTMMQPLMGKALQGLANKEEETTFGKLWQKRVEEILLHTDRTQLLTITTKDSL